MLMRVSRKVILVPALLTLVGGCGGDETPPEDHTPADYTVVVDGTPVEAPYSLVFGETVRVRIQFFNEAGDNLDDVEAEHFAGLTFDPAALATVARVPDHNYQFDVTGNTVGSGTVTIGFGHDEAADEVVVADALPVNVAANTGGNPQ